MQNMTDKKDKNVLYKLGGTKAPELHGPRFQPAAAATSMVLHPCEEATHPSKA